MTRSCVGYARKAASLFVLLGTLSAKAVQSSAAQRRASSGAPRAEPRGVGQPAPPCTIQ